MIEEGSIVQITNREHKWFPALIIVSEMKDFGVMGYCTIPKNDGSGGDAYIRLNKADYELVGTALIIAE